MPRRTLMLMLALWMGNLLPALDATMIGTALPTIVGALEGLHLYGWVFAAYLLTFTTSVPVCGKLADLYGRKPVFAVGIGVYMVASALSGLTQSIEQLILCRALVGIGLGAAVPVAMTIMGDAFSLEQRAKIQWGIMYLTNPPLRCILRLDKVQERHYGRAKSQQHCQPVF